MKKSCNTCKYSQKNTGNKCVKNLNKECAGENKLIRFEYNNWTPIKPILPEELFEI